MATIEILTKFYPIASPWLMTAFTAESIKNNDGINTKILNSRWIYFVDVDNPTAGLEINYLRKGQARSKNPTFWINNEIISANATNLW